MLSFHYPSNHLLIQPVMHTPVLCQLQLSLLSSQDFFSCYTMINEDASLIVHVITFQHYLWLAMHGCACQISIFKLLCSRSSHYSTKVVSIIAPSFLFFQLSTINKCQFYIEKHQHFGSSRCRQWRSPCFSNRDNAIHLRVIFNLVTRLRLSWL